MVRGSTSRSDQVHAKPAKVHLDEKSTNGRQNLNPGSKAEGEMSNGRPSQPSERPPAPRM